MSSHIQTQNDVPVNKVKLALFSLQVLFANLLVKEPPFKSINCVNINFFEKDDHLIHVNTCYIYSELFARKIYTVYLRILVDLMYKSNSILS